MFAKPCAGMIERTMAARGHNLVGHCKQHSEGSDLEGSLDGELTSQTLMQVEHKLGMDLLHRVMRRVRPAPETRLLAEAVVRSCNVEEDLRKTCAADLRRSAMHVVCFV